MDEILFIKFVSIYFTGFIISLGVSAITSSLEIGFRTRVFYSAVWFIWMAITILAFVFAFVYAFIKDSTVEEGLQKVMEIKIVNKIVSSIG